MAVRVFAYAKFNLGALLLLAENIRGQHCTCDTTVAPQAGSVNWAILVSFDDGLDWIFRSPRTGFHVFMSNVSAAKTLLSEVATLKILREKTSVPVPEVYSFSESWENPIGVPYILMSKADGRQLSDYDWAPLPTPGFTPHVRLLPVSDESRAKVMSQLGGIAARLSTLRFGRIGSLFLESKGKYVVGECLSPALIWQHRDSLEDLLQRGPFLQESEYLESLVSAFVGHAKELPLTPHAFFAPIPNHAEYPTWSSYRAAVSRWNDYVAVGSKVDSSKNRLDFCIAGQLLRRMIPRLSTPDDSYTLSHPDLHGGNIFVDDDFNVTCIIDWGSASTGPISELMTTPRVQTEPPAKLVAAFRQGFEAEHLPPPGSWERASMMWYFSRLVRLLSRYDFPLFKSLYSLVYSEDVDDTDITTQFNTLATEASNQELLAALKADDLSASEVEKEEVAAFGSDPSRYDCRAVARKMTTIAQMNENFVTSSKLWRWIEAALGT